VGWSLHCVCRTEWAGVTRFKLRDQGRGVVNMVMCPAVLTKCEQRLEMRKLTDSRNCAT